MNVSAAGQCEIVAVALQKGGVGKTTTTINLGASLAAMAQLECDLLDVAGGRAHHFPTDFGRTGERDFANVRVLR